MGRASPHTSTCDMGHKALNNQNIVSGWEVQVVEGAVVVYFRLVLVRIVFPDFDPIVTS